MRQGWRWGLVALALALFACEQGDVGPPIQCIEYVRGEKVPPEVLGSEASRTKVESGGELAVLARQAMYELTAICLDLAGDVPPPADFAADARVAAACKLAAAATPRTPLPADPICVPNADVAAACTQHCIPESVGCTDICEARARAMAVCTRPEGSLGSLLALRARLVLVMELSAQVKRAVEFTTDIKAACIAPSIVAVSDALRDAATTVSAADVVIAAAKGETDGGT